MSADDISCSQGFWLYFACVYAYMKRGSLILELWLTDFTVTCRPIKNSLEECCKSTKQAEDGL